MNKKLIALTAILTLVALLLAACSGAATRTSVPAPTASSTAANSTANSSAQTSTSAFQTKSNSGGSVTVDVKPTALEAGQAIAFDIAMNTHSVDLSDDMTKITILRDDSGKEYKPTAWQGGEPGGHHRAGTLTFVPLSSKPKYVELVIRGLAQVPERVFRWDLP